MTEIRFRLDQNVDPAIADGLRRRGVNVTTTQEAALLGVEDAAQLAFASGQGRVLVTHDEGLLSLASRADHHAGIAYCHDGSRSIGQVIAALMLIRDCLSADNMRSHVEFL